MGEEILWSLKHKDLNTAEQNEMIPFQYFLDRYSTSWKSYKFCVSLVSKL